MTSRSAAVFITRALDSEPLTVYAPGTQSRNYIHVDDVARAYVHSTERLLSQLENGKTVVEDFAVDISNARFVLGWEPEHTIKETIRSLIRDADESE